MIKVMNTTMPCTTQSGNYTLKLGDANSLITMTSALGMLLTVPTDALVNFPVGTSIAMRQGGAGQVTVSGAVTLNNVGGLKSAAQYSISSLTKVAVNTWTIVGNLSS
jgi:hypothetical protein